MSHIIFPHYMHVLYVLYVLYIMYNMVWYHGEKKIMSNSVHVVCKHFNYCAFNVHNNIKFEHDSTYASTFWICSAIELMALLFTYIGSV